MPRSAEGQLRYRDAVRRVFDSPAGRYEQQVIFGRIQPQHPALEAFACWEEVLGVLRNRDAERDWQDRLLLALVQELHARPKNGALTLLNVAMYPMLDRVYRERLKFTGSPEDRDDLWSKITGAFAEAVERYPEHRTRHLAANLQGETYAALRRSWDGERRLQKARQGMSQAVPSASYQAPIGDEPSLSLFEIIGTRSSPSDLPPDYAEAERRLDTLAPWLPPEERRLVLEVEVKDRGIREVAVELGIKHEAAKKRLQRARARIRQAWPRGWTDDSGSPEGSLSPE